MTNDSVLRIKALEVAYAASTGFPRSNGPSAKDIVADAVIYYNFLKSTKGK